MSAVCCFNILFEFCVSLNWSCLFRRDLPNTNLLLASSLLGLQLWFCIFTISEFYNWGILRFIHTSFKRMLPFCGNIRHRENYCTAKFTAKKCQMQNKRKKQRIFFSNKWSDFALHFIVDVSCLFSMQRRFVMKTIIPRNLHDLPWDLTKMGIFVSFGHQTWYSLPEIPSLLYSLVCLVLILDASSNLQWDDSNARRAFCKRTRVVVIKNRWKDLCRDRLLRLTNTQVLLSGWVWRTPWVRLS